MLVNKALCYVVLNFLDTSKYLGIWIFPPVSRTVLFYKLYTTEIFGNVPPAAVVLVFASDRANKLTQIFDSAIQIPLFNILHVSKI